MSQTKWAVEGADTSVIEVNGRRFGANDDGAPLLVRQPVRIRDVSLIYPIVFDDLSRAGPPRTHRLLSHAARRRLQR